MSRRIAWSRRQRRVLLHSEENKYATRNSHPHGYDVDCRDGCARAGWRRTWSSAAADHNHSTAAARADVHFDDSSCSEAFVARARLRGKSEITGAASPVTSWGALAGRRYLALLGSVLDRSLTWRPVPAVIDCAARPVPRDQRFTNRVRSPPNTNHHQSTQALSGVAAQAWWRLRLCQAATRHLSPPPGTSTVPLQDLFAEGVSPQEL